MQHGLEIVGRGVHGLCRHKHFGHEYLAEGEVAAEPVHADHQRIAYDSVGGNALLDRRLRELDGLCLLPLVYRVRELFKRFGSVGLYLYGGLILLGKLCLYAAGGTRGLFAGHVQDAIIFINLVVNEGVNVLEHRAGKTVGDRGDEAAAGGVFLKRGGDVGANLLLSRVGAVDSGADAAHEHHPAAKALLQFGDVILRQNALPALNTYLRHILDDGGEVGVGVVDDHDAAGADVAVQTAVRLLEELAPDIRLHEQRVLGAPVVVRENEVGVQPVY